jgi:hypothetical protein
MSNYNDITGGLRVPAQIPLDTKLYAQSETVLKNLGVNNQLAFTYYKGMIAYCADESTRWEWKGSMDPRTDTRRPNGLIRGGYTYPPGVIVNGIDYGDINYNFFPVTAGVSITNFNETVYNTTNNSSTVILNPVSVDPDQNLVVDFQALVESVSMTFDWKNGTTPVPKSKTDVPSGVTDSVYLRTGYLHAHNAYVGEDGHIAYPEVHEGGQHKLVRLDNIQNLGVKVRGFNNIQNYSPKLVISRYTPTKKKGDFATTEGEWSPGPAPTDKSKHYRKGSFKISKENDPLRPSSIPLNKGYQVIDFGQEHYFRSDTYFNYPGGNDILEVPYKILVAGCNNRYHYEKELDPYHRSTHAYTYLEFQIEIKVGDKTYLSKPLGRLKMRIMVLGFRNNPGTHHTLKEGRIRFTHT